MNVLILILLIGLLESKVQRSLRVHWKHFDQSCSQHNSKHDIANRLVPRQKVKMEAMCHHQKMQLQTKVKMEAMCHYQKMQLQMNVKMEAMCHHQKMQLQTNENQRLLLKVHQSCKYILLFFEIRIILRLKSCSLVEGKYTLLMLTGSTFDVEL